MTNARSLSRKHLRSVAWIGLGVFIGVLVFAFQRPAHALPEYATRTGQTCATCHVNPAGGGPRTLRGLVWLAEGRPDQVPPLPGSEEDASDSDLDGATLFEKFTCSACHGPSGEGGVGPALNQVELPADEISQVTRNGRGTMLGYRPDVMTDAELDAVVQYVQALGRGEGGVGPALNQVELPADEISQVTRNGRGTMLGYNLDVMTDAELDAIVQYVQALGRGEVEAGPILEKRPLPPLQLTCGANPSSSPLRTDCGGN